MIGVAALFALLLAGPGKSPPAELDFRCERYTLISGGAVFVDIEADPEGRIFRTLVDWRMSGSGPFSLGVKRWGLERRDEGEPPGGHIGLTFAVEAPPGEVKRVSVVLDSGVSADVPFSANQSAGRRRFEWIRDARFNEALWSAERAELVVYGRSDELLSRQSIRLPGPEANAAAERLYGEMSAAIRRRDFTGCEQFEEVSSVDEVI